MMKEQFSIWTDFGAEYEVCQERMADGAKVVNLAKVAKAEEGEDAEEETVEE